MGILKFLLLMVAISSTLYYVNYRILLLIKMFVYKEYLDAIPYETDEEIEKFRHSVLKLNGFYRQLDEMEAACFWVMLVMVLSWTTVLYIQIF